MSRLVISSRGEFLVFSCYRVITAVSAEMSICRQNVVAYMEAVGYSRSRYSLLLPYPRRCISDRPDSTLMELDIVADSTLIVDLNE